MSSSANNDAYAKFIERIIDWYEVDGNDITEEELWDVLNELGECDDRVENFLEAMEDSYGIPLDHLYEIWDELGNDYDYEFDE